MLREVENVTNDLAEQPWRALGDRDTARFAEAVRPLSEAAVRALPPSTPLGLLTPEGPWAQRP